MESKRKGSKPKLRRLNAMKNVDYQPPSTLDLPPPSLDLDRQTSFRVVGNDGEFDAIFRTLGVSGPEDFAIPTEAWEARKSRFASSPAPAPAPAPSVPPTHPLPPPPRNSVTDNVQCEISAKFETGVVLNADIQRKNETFQRRLEGKHCDFDVISSDSKVLGYCRDRGGGGIKGVRPPALAPPPSMLRPIIDEATSTWDLLRSFAPRDERGVEENDDVVNAGGEALHGVRHGERGLFSDSSSSYTSLDDDSDVGGEKGTSGMIDDSVHNVSPDGSFRRTFSSWQKVTILGKGSFGTVYEGITDDGFFFAVKEVSLLDEGSQGKQSIFQLQQEISLLSQFEHENIVRYLGADKDKSTLYIFLELVSKGSLASLYQRYRLKDSQVSAYTRQILSGLKYLHDQNVVHRDIKCANILVDTNGSVKLADFGLAKATKLNDVKSSKGSPFWMAPEVVNLRNHGYGLAADIWSLGCTVLEMLTRQPPYSDLEGMQALFRIGKGELPLVPESLSKDARDFIHKCLQVYPKKRPTAAQLLDHPFIKRPFLSSLSSASPRINILRS